MEIQTSEHTDRHKDVQTDIPPSIYLPNKPNPRTTPNTCMFKFCLIKARFPACKGTEKFVREPLDCTEKTYTEYTHRRLFAGHKK